MKVHFIAIGGSAMHNLALALHHKGFNVTGSDDEILEPSCSRLHRFGLLPPEIGWFPGKIDSSLNAVILGMHARNDNPELLKAQELGLRIFSYPEYIYEQTKGKTRVVIGGSHGKTTITSMVMHVLRYNHVEFDYLVGAMLDGFDTMVHLSSQSRVAILEGDEYLSSPVDRRPKFHLYKADIALLSGIAWDHINVFPTFESYLEQFRIFVSQIPSNGSLIYCSNDPEVKKIAESSANCAIHPYTHPDHIIDNGCTFLKTASGKIPLKIFGKHNLQNLNGAFNVCRMIGITDSQFYNAIASFKGAAKRLELMDSNADTAFYKDFAHSPSKLRATISAVKQQYPERKLVACMELHTFSSLNKKFLNEYCGTMDEADIAIVYFNPHTITHKKLEDISEMQVRESFSKKDLRVFTDSEKLFDELINSDWKNSNLLMMSSGNFDGVDFKQLAGYIVN